MNEEKQKKFKATNKLWFYLGGLAGLLAFIGISAWWDLTFGAFDVKDFVADTLILTAICLATMVLSDLLSQEANMNKILGVYNIACNEYNDAMVLVEPIKVYFAQWYFWFLNQETKRKRENYLVLHGIEGTDAQKIVRFATLSDVARMAEAHKKYIKELEDGRKVVLPKLEGQEQIDAVTSVLKGEQDVKNTNYSIYLFTENINESNMSTLERQAYLDKRRKQSRRKAYIMRIVLLILTSLLMAALAPTSEEEANDKNKWWLFLKRLGVFVTSFISGWLAGATDVTARASQIKDKKDKLTIFHDCYEKGLWKPKSEEELDKEFIEEYIKEQKEAAASVVDLEAVDQVPLLEGGNNE